MNGRKTGLGKDSLKVRKMDSPPNYFRLASILPLRRICKSLRKWSLDLTRMGTIPYAGVGISWLAHFFHEKPYMFLTNRAFLIALSKQ